MGFTKRKKQGIYNVPNDSQKETPQNACAQCGAVGEQPCRDSLQRKMSRPHKGRVV